MFCFTPLSFRLWSLQYVTEHSSLIGLMGLTLGRGSDPTEGRNTGEQRNSCSPLRLHFQESFVPTGWIWPRGDGSTRTAH